MIDKTFLYPNVTSVPGARDEKKIDRANQKPAGTVGEFDQVFDGELGKSSGKDLNQVREGIKFSAHATQRLKDRKIQFDPKMMERVNQAIDQAEAKGIEESLVLTPDAALIVSVKNRTVITAMDRASMSGNVFTNIDGAVIL